MPEPIPQQFSQQQVPMSPSPAPQPTPPKRSKTGLIIGGLVVLLLVVGALVWWFVFRSPKEPTPEDTTQPTTPVEEAPYTVTTKTDAFPGDTDADGISDEDEAAQGLDPTQYDSDIDSLPDALELNRLGTDPTNADTDGDGLSDGEEVLIYETDPLNVDTDGDGFSDQEEIQNGYNPLGEGTLN